VRVDNFFIPLNTPVEEKGVLRVTVKGNREKGDGIHKEKVKKREEGKGYSGHP
jgi:hypothetical protein